MFAAIGFLSPSHGHLVSARSSYLTRYGPCVDVQQWEPEALETATDVQLSIVRPSNLTKRRSSWRLKTHWDPCNRSVTPCIEISSVFPKCLRQTLPDHHRLPTDASLRGSLRPFSNHLARKSKNQHCDEKGV